MKAFFVLAVLCLSAASVSAPAYAGSSTPPESAAEGAVSVHSAQAVRRAGILAHAGASAVSPENTLAAFSTAADLGADGIETDVRMTKDQKLVLAHDDKIDATSSGHGRISEMTLEELKACDFGSWFGPEFAGQEILTVEEAFSAAETLGIRTIDFEMKPAADNSDLLVRLLADAVRASAYSGEVIITSFDGDLLKQLKEYAPELSAGILTIPNLSAITLLNLSEYLPAGKALSEYTAEDVSEVPEIVAILLRAFGAHGSSTEEVLLYVIKGIAAVASPQADWSEVEVLINEQHDLVSYVDSLDFPVDYLCCHYNTLTEELIHAMNERGIGTAVWTPDTEKDLGKVEALNPDYIITNQPETASRLYESEASPE